MEKHKRTVLLLSEGVHSVTQLHLMTFRCLPKVTPGVESPTRPLWLKLRVGSVGVQARALALWRSWKAGDAGMQGRSWARLSLGAAPPGGCRNCFSTRPSPFHCLVTHLGVHDTKMGSAHSQGADCGDGADGPQGLKESGSWQDLSLPVLETQAEARRGLEASGTLGWMPGSGLTSHLGGGCLGSVGTAPGLGVHLSWKALATPLVTECPGVTESKHHRLGRFHNGRSCLSSGGHRPRRRGGGAVPPEGQADLAQPLS